MHNRNFLLPQARTVLMQFLLDHLARCQPGLAAAALKNADAARSSLEQDSWITLFTLIDKRGENVSALLRNHLERLFDRALQTAYNTWRPSFPMGARPGELSLIGNDEMEDELLVGTISDRFRNEIADELRNLGIRVALLFGTEEVRERENPFRPWLIARAIADTATELELRPHVASRFSPFVGECLAQSLEHGYAEVNRLLAQHGVAAELAMKIRKTPDRSAQAAATRPDEPAASAAHAATPLADGQPGMPQPAARQELLDAIGRIMQQPGGGTPAGRTTPMPDMPASSTLSDDPLAQRNLDLLLDSMRRYAAVSGHSERMANATGAAATQPGQSPQSSGASPPPSSRGRHSGWLGGIQQIGSRLRSLLGASATAYHGYAAPGHASQPMRTVTPALAACIDALQQQALDTEHLFDARGDLRNLILEQRPQLSGHAVQQEEQMTLDVVAMLFEFILRDPEVPPQVRVELARLQLLILRIALRDPNLLTRRGHPVRLLVNRIASIASAHREIDPGYELVTGKIRQIVDTLLQDTVDDPERFVPLFTRLLDEFDDFIAAELRNKNEKTARAASVFDQVPERVQHYQRVLAQMREALAGQTIDTYLQDFLLKTWVQVIESAEDMEPALALRFRKFVPALLWSLAPKQDEQERQMLMATLPGLVTTLKEGLSLIAWPQPMQKEMLDWLFVIHTRAMFPAETTPQAEAAVARAPEVEHFEPLLANVALPLPEDERPAAEAALFATAARRMGDAVRTVDDDQAEQLAAVTGTTSLPLEDEAGIDEEMHARLHRGVMVELHIDHEPSLARLSWLSSDQGHLLLSLNDDGSPVMMTLRAFRRLFMRQRVRFVEAEPLFERALRSLLDAADQLAQPAGATGSAPG